MPLYPYNTFIMPDKSLPLDTRTVNFSKGVIAFCKSEQQTNITRPLIDQLIRSATSIGANYSEANNAASRTDFKNKIFIAKKEAAETKYWLTLFYDMTSNKEICRELTQECHYLLMTFQKIISTLSNSSRITDKAR